MIYLLDTHYILWSLFEPHKIGEPVLRILENDSDSKLISGVNLWEISLKYSLGKLDLGDTDPRVLFDSLLESGLKLQMWIFSSLLQFISFPRKRTTEILLTVC